MTQILPFTRPTLDEETIQLVVEVRKLYWRREGATSLRPSDLLPSVDAQARIGTLDDCHRRGEHGAKNQNKNEQDKTHIAQCSKTGTRSKCASRNTCS